MEQGRLIKGCESPKHHPECLCQYCQPKNCDDCHENKKLTTQHEIPRNIAKEFFPTEKNRITTIASMPCHRQEDKKVPFILSLMKILREREGMIPTKEDVLTIRKMGMFRG